MQSWSWGDANNNGTLQSSTVWHGGPGYPAFTGFKTTYGYDGVNRLGGATETNVDGTSTYWLRGFGYDQYGNMWTSVNGGVPTWSMMPTSNVFTSANQITGGSYDGAGNQTAIGPYTFQYDAENRLIEASQPASAGGGQVQYSYDAESKRITKSFLSGPSTVYVYDVFGSLAAEYSSAPLTTAPVCGTCYLSTDHLGSTRLVTGENGSVIARHDYLPFGEEIPSGYANRGADWAADDSVKQKFTGQARDSETGNDFFNARYFNGALGRFLSPDPGNAGADLLNPQSWNGYSYVGNNPLARVDPTGMTWLDDIWKGISGFFGGGCGATFCVTGTGVAGIDGSFAALGWGLGGGGGSTSSSSTPPPPPPPIYKFTVTVSANPAKNGSCDAGVIGNFVSKYVGVNTIINGNIATNVPTIELGALLGSLFGPEGTLPGALVGSMFGVGGSVSYVPGTGSLYAGPVATFGLGVNGGSGFSVSAVHVPSTQNANSIANGKSFSLSYQPNPFLGSTVTKSPGSGPPVVGPSVGTKVPVSASAGYSFCLRHCGC
jgi:RHS repeat-associated protein